MNEARLPLLEEEAVHTVMLNGYTMTVKTNYNAETISAEILDGEEAVGDLLDVPLLVLFQFRNKQIYRASKKSWTTSIGGEAVTTTEFVTLKIDKEQIINSKACSKYLSIEEDSDVVLSCGYFKFHVNKQKLGDKSMFFKAMFNSDFIEKEQEKINIRDMDGETLHSLLLISYSARFRITDFNVEPIMIAADRFGMEGVLHKCADHLSINSKLAEFKRLQLLDRYNQEDCIDELIGTIKSKVSIREDNEFDNLTDGSQIKILREAVKELKQRM